ncbi:cell division protein ZapE [Rubrobacter marinus]|uniref:Cell division protein ZapE n=1 Tax=Rubrobacter marinus TaxID=2653852 RepID=A0A6G8PRU4_9ACTN|nr:AFG1/ZapE family ATPase [Rubrobacter marinus]QIN77208.1 cell division protein ZapE [Rubrobacter marinus]
MEPIGDLLPDAGRAMSGSSASRKRGSGHEGSALRLDDQVCPHCGNELAAEFFEFPPALQRKYGKTGEWYYHPCTPECEAKNERREWELMRRDARVASLKEKSGLTKRLKRYTLDNFKPYVGASAARAVERAEEFLRGWEDNREEGRGLYLCGDVGTGKTHLAVAIMTELIRRRRVPSLFVTVPEFLDNLRGAYNDPGRDIDEWMDAVKNADLLVLDDLGAEKPNAWVRERLFVVVNHRYREALPTIFTSNIGPKDLAEQLGDRTASRIIAMCEWVALEGEDYRETAAREGR